MSDSDSKIEEYKKLIRENGIDVAIVEVDKSGIAYSENFTESHVTDPIFSSPRLPPTKNMDVKLFDLVEHGSIAERIVLKNFEDKPNSINTNLEFLISDVTISVESGTGVDAEVHKPNVTIQTT